MEQITNYIFSLPIILISTIFGSIVALIVGKISSIIMSKNKSKHISKILAGLSLIITMFVTYHLGNTLKDESIAKKLITDLSKNQLFATIFTLHPESVTELKTKYKVLLNAGISDEMLYAETHKIGSMLVLSYLQTAIPNASDKTIHTFLEHNVTVMRSLQNTPALCVSYYFAHPLELSQDIQQKEAALKADIIASAAHSPSPLNESMNIDNLVSILSLSYYQKGYDIKHLSEVGIAQTLPPKKGCQVAIEFLDSIASLDEQQASYVFKSMVSLSGPESSEEI